MTPLAMKFAKQLTLPLAKRNIVDAAEILPLFGQDLHCFDVCTISGNVDDAINHDKFIEDAESMAHEFFLPSPVTWLERKVGKYRQAIVIQDIGGRTYKISIALEDERTIGSIPMETVRFAHPLEKGPRIDFKSESIEQWYGDEQSSESIHLPKMKNKKIHPLLVNNAIINEVDSTIKMTIAYKTAIEDKLFVIHNYLENAENGQHFKRIAFVMFTLSLINTPGLVGLKQHPPHKGLAKQLVGKFPLRSWSEIVLKHQTKVYDGPIQETGSAFHKCLHFVRSHKRHYTSGKVTIIPAHWRGDPALGIKQTRYRVTT